jgi:hypothetical protein
MLVELPDCCNMHQHISTFCFLRIPVDQKTGCRSSAITHIYLSPPKGFPTYGTRSAETECGVFNRLKFLSINMVYFYQATAK